MRPDPQAVRLFATLKALLKRRRLKYRDLAAHLGLSLPTVKKFMADCDVDLGRLLAICELLGTSLADVTALSRTQGDEILRFTPEQEEFFAANVAYYCYFDALNGGNTPAEIAARHGLTQRSTQRYLKGLEEIGLVARLPGDGVRLLRRGAFTVWDDFGPLGRAYTRQYVTAMAERALAAEAGSDTLHLMTGSRSVTEAQYAEWQADLEALVDKYRIITSANRAGATATRPIQFLFVTDVWRDPFFDAVPNL